MGEARHQASRRLTPFVRVLTPDSQRSSVANGSLHAAGAVGSDFVAAREGRRSLDSADQLLPMRVVYH